MGVLQNTLVHMNTNSRVPYANCRALFRPPSHRLRDRVLEQVQPFWSCGRCCASARCFMIVSYTRKVSAACTMNTHQSFNGARVGCVSNSTAVQPVCQPRRVPPAKFCSQGGSCTQPAKSWAQDVQHTVQQPLAQAAKPRRIPNPTWGMARTTLGSSPLPPPAAAGCVKPQEFKECKVRKHKPGTTPGA